MPQFSPPVLRDAMPHSRRNKLFRHYGGIDAGQTLVKVGGQWSLVSYPSQGRPDAPGLDQAEEYYLGGHIYTITDAKAAELMAAGYPVQGHWESEEEKWAQYAINSTINLAYKGGDGCSSQYQPASGLYIWLFADTFIGTNNGEYYNFVLPVRNSMVYQDSNRNIAGQVYHNFVNGPAFQHPENPDKWWWPIDVCDEGGVTHVSCWEVTWGGTFGTLIQNTLLTLNIFGGVAATVNLPVPGNDFFIQGVWEENDYFYILGLEYDVTRGGYDNYNVTTSTFTRLARVPQGSFTSVGAWQYWNGSTWVSNQVDAAPLLDNHHDRIEGDVALTKVGDQYIIAVKGTISPGVRVYSSPTITGPYVFQYSHEAEGGTSSNAKTVATYLPKFHEHMFPAGDNTMVLTYNTNTFGSTGGSIANERLRDYTPNFLYLPVP